MNVEKISRFYKRIPRSKEAYSRLIRKTFNVPGKLSGFQNAILFGAENLGKKTLASFRKKGINILAFSDNDKNKWGSLVENVPVIPPRSIKYQPYSFVIITSKYVKEIHTQLRKEKARGILPHYVLSVLFPNVFPDVFYPTCFAKIMRQRPKVTEAYRALSGSKSKKLFLQLLEFMIFLLPEDIPSPEGGQYFPEELPLLKDNETYVDVGAFTGDTLKVFLSRTGGRFHKYIALEPDKDNFRKLVNGIPRLYKDKIICIRAAASSKNGKVSFCAFGAEGRDDSVISDKGTETIKCVTLDSICRNDKVTSIKADVEGHEPSVLDGARKILKEQKPKLAICVYHKPEHLWDLLLQIKRINPEYSKFYLRHHYPVRYETVLYAQ